MSPDELEAHVNNIVARLSDRSGGLNAASDAVRDYIRESEIRSEAYLAHIEGQSNQILTLKETINKLTKPKKKKGK